MSPDDLAWPPGSGPEALKSALTTLADTISQSRDYFAVLDAIGNNHRGTYFSCVLVAVPALGPVLRGSEPIPRLRAMDVLLDLLGSFAPDPEHTCVATEGGSRPLEHRLREVAVTLLPDLERLVRHAASDEERAMAASSIAWIRRA